MRVQAGALAEAIDAAVTEADQSVIGGTFDAARYGAPGLRVHVGEPTGTNHAFDTTFGAAEMERQPGGDDTDLDEDPKEPPNFRRGSGSLVCWTCPHFSIGGRVGSAPNGACMLWTWPVQRLDVCDDWTTLTPQDAQVTVYEAELREAEAGGDPDEIVLARAALATARRRAEEADRDDPRLHPAHRSNNDLTVEEAVGAWEESRHPRARGGKFARVSFKAMKRDGGSHTLEGHDLGNGLVVAHRKNGVSGIAEHQVYHRETGHQVAAIGDKGEDRATVHDALARHFDGNYRGKSVEQLRADDGLKSKAKSVGKVYQALQAQRVAQDRTRRLHNERVAQDEARATAGVVTRTKSGAEQAAHERGAQTLARKAKKDAEAKLARGEKLSEREHYDLKNPMAGSGTSLTSTHLGKLSDEALQPLIDSIMDYPESVRKVIAREGNKRAQARRRAGPVEEADWIVEAATIAFNPLAHPRGRGGKFRDVLGKLKAISPGHTQHFKFGMVTRDHEHHDVFALQHGPNLTARGTAEEIASHVSGEKGTTGLSVTIHGTRSKPDAWEPGDKVMTPKGAGTVLHKSKGWGDNAEFAVDTGKRTEYGGMAATYHKGSSLKWHPDEVKDRETKIAAQLERAAGSGSKSQRQIGTSNPVTLTANIVPVEWQIEHGYRGTNAYDKGTRMRSGVDVEQMIYHFLTGHRASAPKGGDAAVQQFTYKSKAKKADREALIRKITQALDARLDDDTDAYVKLLFEAVVLKRLSDAAEALEGVELPDAAVEFLGLQEAAADSGVGEIDEDLGVYLDVMVEEAKLSAAARKKLKPEDHAIPPDRYPIHDENHARNALARVAQNGSPDEQAQVKKKVYARYPHLKKDD